MRCADLYGPVGTNAPVTELDLLRQQLAAAEDRALVNFNEYLMAMAERDRAVELLTETLEYIPRPTGSSIERFPRLVTIRERIAALIEKNNEA